MIYIGLILFIVGIVCFLLGFRKNTILLTERRKLEADNSSLKEHIESGNKNLKDILQAIQSSNSTLDNTLNDLEKITRELHKNEELNSIWENKIKELEFDYEKLFAAKKELYSKKSKEYEEQFQNLTEEIDIQLEEELKKVQEQVNKYNSLIQPLIEAEKDNNELFSKAIQIEEKYKDDIKFLLNEVAPRMHDKDIIPKLIWSTYFLKPTQELMKRLNIEDTPGIYRITNLLNKKVYIGKSVTIRQRLINHIKGACGISSISDQEVHRAMAQDGIWNFSFEKICDGQKDELSELEKFYIKSFQGEQYGYNRNSGG